MRGGGGVGGRGGGGVGGGRGGQEKFTWMCVQLFSGYTRMSRSRGSCMIFVIRQISYRLTHTSPCLPVTATATHSESLTFW